jgi:hypothetical protein
MDETTLKTYDIASYDIELEYNKETAPIEKAIQSLVASHEAKSLKAHKDFLSKEQKSKQAIAQLAEKSVLKHQRIERAVENKLKRLEPRRRRYEAALDEYVTQRTAEADEAKAAIEATIAQLHQDESDTINDIKNKYKTNIESYVEKLDIYNQNYKRNQATHKNQITQYEARIVEHRADVERFLSTILEELTAHLEESKAMLEHDNDAIATRFKDIARQLNNTSTTIRKQSNKDMQDIDQDVNAIKSEYDSHYQDAASRITARIQERKELFQQRKTLIEQDLQVQLDRLAAQEADLAEGSDKTVRKSIQQKRQLFQLRADTTIQYEERLLDEQLLLLERERQEFEHEHHAETENLEKLRVILLQDQVTLKDASETYKDLNIRLREQLDGFERRNNEYLYKHEQLKSDFIAEYTRIFAELKQASIDLAASYLGKIATNNQQIDDIQTFLDTAEPLKEIEVNRMRENIEISEVQERFKIKYAKERLELDKIDAALAHDIRQREIDTRELISAYQKDVADIRHKETYDKAIEQAKLKFKQAQEAHKLRLDRIQLERKQLDNRYDTETSILDHKLELAILDLKKRNARTAKEMEYTIADLETEARYEVEVIQKGLEEELLQHEEQLSRLEHERDAYDANMNQTIETKRAEIEQEKAAVSQQFTDTLERIDKALEREIRAPQQNRIKTETVIDERLKKLDRNNASFADFIAHAIEAFSDDHLSLDQIQEVIHGDDSISDQAVKYLTRAYDVLREAVTFMADVDERSKLNRIAATSDQGRIRKLQKDIERIHQDRDKRLSEIRVEESDRHSIIRLAVTEMRDQLKRTNPSSVKDMLEATDLAYQTLFRRLADQQEAIKNTIQLTYQPLLEVDEDLISHANQQAAQAKTKVLQEQQAALAPYDKMLTDFIAAEHQKQATFRTEIDAKIASIKDRIQGLKGKAMERTKQIRATLAEQTNSLRSSREQQDAAEERAIAETKEAFAIQRQRLTKEYEDMLRQLDRKTQEAAKIFAYEERIHGIAVDSATARYNDALVKSESAHLNNVEQYRIQRAATSQQRSNLEAELDAKLREKTKIFERNIFTVRPRLEESIGGAQKEIDLQIEQRTRELEQRQQENERLVDSAETALFATYQDSTDKLSNNLQRYIEKYRLIEEEFDHAQTEGNQLVRDTHKTFADSLRTIFFSRHTRTLEQLQAINARLFAKEA